jgi:hypothetical protein
MLLEPGLTLALLLFVHGHEKVMAATENALGLEVGHTGQAGHGIQAGTAFQGFCRGGGEFLPVGVTDDAHAVILSRQGDEEA